MERSTHYIWVEPDLQIQFEAGTLEIMIFHNSLDWSQGSIYMTSETFCGVTWDEVDPRHGKNAFRRLVIKPWLPLLIVSIMPVIWLSISFFNWSKRRKLAMVGKCPSCGYDLTGNESGVCPECGASKVGSSSDSA